MYQATTPKLRFTTPYEASQISDLLLTFSQGAPVINFGISDVELDTYGLTVELTQEQPKRFKTKIPVEIQMRIKLTDGTVVASQIISTDIHKSLNLEVL